MMSSMQERRVRGRRRLWWGAGKAVVALAVLAGLGVFAYRAGVDAGGRDTNGLRQEVAVLEATIADLQAQLAEASQPAAAPPEAPDQAAVSRELEPDAPQDADLLDRLLERNAELEAQLDRMSAGPLQTLTGLLQQKLAEGVEAARLQSVIQSIGRERSCAEEAVSRRFVVRTPLRVDEANDSVTFAGNAIAVTAEGAVPPDAQGRARLRFDPAQPVTVRFTVRGGATSEVRGVLPLEHSVVLGDREHLFTAEPGEPGFLRVTDRVCAYP